MNNNPIGGQAGASRTPKCLVTGATGFLGTNLVHELVQNGWVVRAMGLPGSETEFIKDLPVEIVFGDVADPVSVDRAVRGVDVAFNVAGDTSWWRKKFDRQRRTNVDGPVNLARACITHGVKRLVHTSTNDAFGYNPGGAADETWSDYNYTGWGYNYADTKREGEQKVLEFNGKGLEVVVINPGSMLGPFDFTLQYGRLFFDLRDGKVPGCPPGGVAFAHVREVARAHIAAAERGRPGERYLCSGVNHTYRELFEAIAQKFGKHAPRFDLPRWFFVAYGRAMEFISDFTKKPPEVDPGMARYMSVKAYYDSTKAVRELGFCILPLDRMIDDAYVWYKENGFL
jgi:dihydroflavonol-4-reductase